MISLTVHALLEGRPLCGFSNEIPALWPSGHIWTEPSDLKGITCKDCKHEAQKMTSPKESTTTAVGEKIIVQVGDNDGGEDGGPLRI